LKFNVCCIYPSDIWWFPFAGEKFDPIESEVMAVAPRAEDVDHEVLAGGQFRYDEI